MLDFHPANAEERDAAFRQVHGLWPHADDPAVHLLKRQHAVQQSRAEWFVGTRDGEVYASCGAYPMTLFGPGGSRAARGFGAVFCEEGLRGQGIAAAMLRHVMDHYRLQSVHDFVLFSDIDPRYYEKLGFHRLPSWCWEIPAAALLPEASWTLERSKAHAEDAGSLGCDFGIARSAEDLVWVMAKQEGALRKTLVKDRAGQTVYWLLSSKKGRTYTFLESNIPQDRHHWELFRLLVAADCHRAKCQRAVGWWTPANAQDLPGPEIRSRETGILMWTSSRGAEDPWLPDVTAKGFRVFGSEQF